MAAPTNMAPVGNDIVTSKLTQILSLEMAKKAGFLKIGSRDYFSDQINGKMRSGKTYQFVLPDAGNVIEGLVISPRPIDEKKVDLTITNMNNSVRADALECVTDIKWEDEVAAQYAGKLVNAIVRKEVEKAMPAVNTCFVGEGFRPLAKAGAHLQSIVNEKIVGFINPQAQAIVTTNGQQFQPVGTPDLYGKGDVGNFQGVNYTSERFLKPLTIEQGVADALSAAKAKNLDAAHLDELGISGVTTAANTVLKAGTPIWVDGAFACDTVGDVTTVPYAFVVKEDVALNATSVTAKVEPVQFKDVGSRSISTSAIGGKKVSIPGSGTYHAALLRAEGSYDYTPVNTMEFMLSEKTAVGDTDGIKVFANAFTDGTSATNTVRWDSPYLAGQVEARGASLVYLKDVE
jgi:hypothetical protein